FDFGRPRRAAPTTFLPKASYFYKRIPLPFLIRPSPLWIRKGFYFTFSSRLNLHYPKKEKGALL
ncbi:MAG: hypothetical protein IJF04_08185, partial [Oscillospiraceae bacterium]|nr:hypothetical protein [Oscillospiraceae bacterium]